MAEVPFHVIALRAFAEVEVTVTVFAATKNAFPAPVFFGDVYGRRAVAYGQTTTPARRAIKPLYITFRLLYF
jgi:hypothetical protein